MGPQGGWSDLMTSFSALSVMVFLIPAARPTSSDHGHTLICKTKARPIFLIEEFPALQSLLPAYQPTNNSKLLQKIKIKCHHLLIKGWWDEEYSEFCDIDAEPNRVSNHVPTGPTCNLSP